VWHISLVFRPHPFYAHSLDWLLGPWQQTGTITAPADGPVSWTDRADAAEAAALILAGDRSFDGPVTLTAADAVTFDDIAQIASTLAGRTIERVVADDEQWIADRVAAGSPEAMARLTLTTFQAARQNRFAGVDPLLVELLGRAPRSVTDLLTDRITGQSHSSH
jgi:uncharacterized protein YbjT (DUF2867 family)